MRAKVSTHVSAQQSEKFIQPSSRLDRVKYLVKFKKKKKKQQNIQEKNKPRTSAETKQQILNSIMLR